MKLIYQGKTRRSLRIGIEFPQGFQATISPNHWSNEVKCIEHIEQIIVPYVKAKRAELGLCPDQKALPIFDVFKGQKTEPFLACLAAHDLIVVYVPANMTKYFQPLDLTVNGISKTFLKDKFAKWYAEQVTSQLNGGGDIYSIKVKLQLSVLKSIGTNRPKL